MASSKEKHDEKIGFIVRVKAFVVLDKESVHFFKDSEEVSQIYRRLNDTALVQKWFDGADMKYVRVKHVHQDLQLECFATNLHDFDKVQKASKNGLFEDVLKRFLVSLDIESSLGVPNEKLQVCTEMEKSSAHADVDVQSTRPQSTSHPASVDKKGGKKKQQKQDHQGRRMEFILYLSEDKAKDIVKVEIVSHRESYTLRQNKIHNHIWTTGEITLKEQTPTDSFKYVLTYSGWIRNPKEIIDLGRLPENIQCFSVAVRDDFCLKEFVDYVIDRNGNDVKTSLTMLQEFFDQTQWPDTKGICDLFLPHQSSISMKACSIFCLGRLLSQLSLSELTRIITANVSKTLLASLRDFVQKDFPPTVHTDVLRGAYALVMLVHNDDKKNCAMIFMDYVLSFSSCETVVRFIMDLEKLTGNQTGQFPFVSEGLFSEPESVSLMHGVIRRLYLTRENKDSTQLAGAQVQKLIHTVPLEVLTKLVLWPNDLKEFLNQEAIESELKIRLSKQLQNAEKLTNVHLLHEVCTCLASKCFTEEWKSSFEEQFTVESSLRRILSDVKKTDKIPVDVVEAIITLRCSWQNPDVMASFLQVLSTSKNEHLRDLFITFACRPDLHPDQMNNLDTMIHKWFETAMSALPISSVEKLKSATLLRVYELLSKCSQVHMGSKNSVVPELGEKIRTLWRNVDILDLVRHLVMDQNDDTFSTSVEDIFRDHFETAIQKADDTTRDSLMYQLGMQTSDAFNVKGRRSGETLKCVIQSSGILKCSENSEETFIFILKNFRFWKRIKNVTGLSASVVKESSAFEVLNGALTDVARDFMMMRVTSSLMRELMEKEEIDEVIADVLRNADVVEVLMKRREAADVLKKTEKNLQLVLKVIDVLFVQFHARIPDVKNAADEVKKKMDLFKSGKVRIVDLQRPDFLEEFSDMLPVIESVHEVADSSVFWAICEKLDFESNDSQPEKSTEMLCEVSDDASVAPSHSSAAADTATEGAQSSRSSGNASGSPGERSCRFPFTRSALQQMSKHGCEKYENLWKTAFGSKPPLLSDVLDIFGENYQKETNKARALLDQDPPPYLADANDMIVHFPEYHKQTEYLSMVLKSLSADASNDAEFQHVKECVDKIHSKSDFESLTVDKLSSARNTVRFLEDFIDPNMHNIIEAIAQHPSLTDFLHRIMDDDIRVLIDAVEENSEQTIQESTVSALIDVKTFLLPVLKLPPKERSVRRMLETMQMAIKDGKGANIPEKIADCVNNLHGLESLFASIANRGEMTRHIVGDMMQSDDTNVTFELQNDGACQVIVTYSVKKGVTKRFSHDDLADLRGRVLLLINKESSSGRDKAAKDHYVNFISFADTAFNVANVYEQLKSSGHPQHAKSSTLGPKRKDQIQETLTYCQSQLSHWEKTLQQCRRQHNSLNFYYPDQLWEIQQCLEKKDRKNAVNLLKFAGYSADIFPDIQNRFHETRFQPAGEAMTAHASLSDSSQALYRIGKAFDAVFKGARPAVTEIPSDEKRVPSTHVASSVPKGQLFVTALIEGSGMLIPTFLALFRNTTGCLPLPYQVLFCQEDTTVHEIDLFLLRFEGYTSSSNYLFCIASVECLENEVQFHLVDALKKIPFGKVSAALAIICLGSNHPIVDHFSQCIHQVQPLTSKELQNCLHKLSPEVHTVTSELPGQGKTEWARNEALKLGKRMKTLHLSGDSSIADILSLAQKLSLTEMDVLHIDASIVTRPADLDVALFRLIVLGFLAHRSVIYFLPTKHVLIEIANTISHTLRNSLMVCTNFKRKSLGWNNFEDFMIRHEICSSVQVVCHYLQALENGTTDSVDLYFTGPQKVLCLHDDVCRQLLRHTFSAANDLSFTVVNTFLRVLADQLKKLSCSFYFRTSTIADMLGEEFFPVKSTLVKALCEVSKEFSNRSVQACRADQIKSVSEGGKDSGTSTEVSATSATATAMVKRVSTMIQWSESNHLILVFHNKDIHTLSALYRSLAKVPEHIKNLFKTQGKPLEEIHCLQQQDLQQMLVKIARFTPGDKDTSALQQMARRYALTPDNILKMILVVERVKAQIPVIIMGETGCGKTSLIRYLSQMCDIGFEVHNIHAGIEEAEIVAKVETTNKQAVEKLLATKPGEPVTPIWLFFDEINTCNHMGLLNDIVCHHMLHGRCLAPNLIIMAACNPYKLRNEKTIHSAGLQSKVKTDELSKLVYRVNPLPESMVDYVWDYGTLSEADEESYIERMVKGVATPSDDALLVELLVRSQKFVKEVEQSDSCVSLRDVNRCRILVEWFKRTLKEKGGHDGGETDAFVLALAHCYHCRLSDKKDRERYREAMTTIFRSHKAKNINNQKDILHIIYREQSDLLNRMDLPEGTAKNSALRENIFVMFVCIMNCIPVFVVGKPGCSKSLSLQLIKSNLRGKDSKDPYFQTLPQLFCVSYQGSESSTSDGISKVFQKAQRYLKNETQSQVLPVVVLDEIGLAEVSRFNPLKVLHTLLEPPDREFPEVAVVGISNWSLDAAKMNRAIHLSRTDMDADELYDTAVAISEATVTTEDVFNPLLPKGRQEIQKKTLDKSLLEAIAKAYFEYVRNQRFSNFHGLRDFYSLVKYISKEIKCHHSSDDSMQIITKGLLRNFGGLPSEKESLLNTFRMFVKKTAPAPPEEKEKAGPTLLELVKENVEDLKARHLMLITRGDTALYMIDDILNKVEREREIILGSRFEEDLTDDYNYRILSRVILCMEQGVVLILKDLDGIYGSLYDMLNQNYTTVGRGKHQKQSCRVALGAYSNPLCQVHPQFRCIVLVEHSKLDLSDPPFLNRFEKQQMHLSDILVEESRQLVLTLEEWLHDLSNIPDHSFHTGDLIPLFSSDLVPSLLLSLQQRKCDSKQILPEAKKRLMSLCSPEAIVRTNMCQVEVQFDRNEYWSLPCHEGLPAYLKSLLHCGEERTHSVLQSIVVTHSSIHSPVSDLLPTESQNVQIEKLGAFKSEKQLTSRLKLYWENPHTEWLVIQCSSSEDMDNFLLLKSLIDKEISNHSGGNCNKKHCLLLIHINRREEPESLGLINFLCGWDLAFVDLLEPKDIGLLKILKTPFMDLVTQMRPLHSFIEGNLFWAFSCIEYTNRTRNMDDFQRLLSCITQKQRVMDFLEECILTFLKESGSMDTSDWQTNVACNGGLLQKHLSFHTALMTEVHKCLRHPLAAVIYNIELANGWDALLSEDNDSTKMKAWFEIVSLEKMQEVKDILPPTRPECYPCSEPIYALKHPFSKLFIERIDRVKNVFMENVRSKMMEEDRDEISREDFLVLCSLHEDQVKHEAGFGLFGNTYGNEQFDDYFTDFCCIKSGRLALVMTPCDRTEILKKAITPMIEGSASLLHNVTQLHAVYWLFGSDFEAQLLLIDACSRMTTQMKIEQILDECLKKDMEDKLVGGVVNEPGEEDQTSSSEMSDDEVPAMTESEAQNQDTSENTEESETTVTDEILYQCDKSATEDKEFTEDASGATCECGDASQLDSKGTESYSAKKSQKTMGTIPDSKDVDEGLQNEDINSQEGSDKAPSEKKFDDKADSDATNSISSKAEKQTSGKLDALKPLSSRLVESTCVKLTPSRESVKHVDSLEIWQQNISLILSLAAEVSLEPDALQCLRFCNDFASCLMLPYKKPSELLGDLGGKLENSPMDDEVVYGFMKKVLGESKDISEREKQCIMSYYVTSCMINDPDTEALKWFLQDIVSEETCRPFLLGPALGLAMGAELDVEDEQQQLSSIVRIIRYGCIPDQFPFLTFFANLMQKMGQSVFDHPLPCILIDLLQHCYFKGVVLDHQTLESPELVNLILECHEVFISPGFTMQHIAAIAFLKAALQSFGQTLVQSSMKFGNKAILQKLDGILSLRGNDPSIDRRIKSLQRYFLRTVLQGGGSKALLPFIEAHRGSFTHLKTLSSEDLTRKPCQDAKISHDIGSSADKISKMMENLPKSRSDLKTWTKNCKSTPEIVLFLSLAAEKFYLLRGFRSLTDAENEQATDLYESSSMLPPNQKRLLERLCSLQDMKADPLKLTSESGDFEYQLAAVVTHLLCKIEGMNPNNSQVNDTAPIWQKLIQAPQALAQLYLPGIPKKRDSTSLSFHKMLKVSMRECDCGYISFQKGTTPVDRCIACNHEYSSENLTCPTDSTVHEGRDYLDYVGYSVGSLSPVAYRMLQLFVHICLLGSLALEYTEPSALQVLLPEALDDIMQYLQNHIQLQWQCLGELTSLGDGQLRQFLHVVISSGKIGLDKEISQFKTSDDRDKYEMRFDKCLCELVSNRFHLIQQGVNAKQLKEGESWDAYIAETEVDSTLTSEGAMPRAFRETVAPTISNMKHEFLLNKDHERDYPLLALVIVMEEELALLQNLWTLVHWHFCCVKHASFKLKKIECQEMTVAKFIQNVNDSMQKEVVKGAFQELRNSWNSLREHEACLKRYNTSLPAIPPLHQECKLDSCIIIGQHSPLEELINSLVNMHNAFLLTAVKLSLHGKSPTISFLRSTGCQTNDQCLLPHVSLENVSLKQIIHLELDPKLLRFSQLDCSIGHGRLIHYDFYQIEQELATETLINKPLLSNKLSSRIDFVGEAFLRPAALLGTINKLVPQDPLDKEVRSAIDDLQKKNPAGLSELLNVIEMMLCLLKRARGDKDMSAFEYMMKWKFLVSVSAESIKALLLKIPLRHSVAVYEYVESLLADMIIENREGSLPEHMHSHVSAAFATAESRDLEIISTALKRFAYRALTVPKNELMEPLTHYLEEPSLWSEKEISDRKLEDILLLLPPDAGIDNVQQLVHFIKATIEERKKKADFSWMASTSGTPDKAVTPATSLGQRKKFAKKWKKK